MITIDQEYAKYKGQSVLVPGEPESERGQCVQWADYVLHDVYGLPYHYGNAIDWWNNPKELLTENFNKISDGSIKKGDFVIFNTNVGSVYGHIDVAMQDGSFNNFQGSDSNWGGNKTVHLVQHNAYVLGALRKKGSSNMLYPNEGDLINAYNSTGWPGHPPNGNDIAYWTKGTNNPNWNKGADQVQKDLLYAVMGYVNTHKPTQPVNATKLGPGLYQV